MAKFFSEYRMTLFWATKNHFRCWSSLSYGSIHNDMKCNIRAKVCKSHYILQSESCIPTTVCLTNAPILVRCTRRGLNNHHNCFHKWFIWQIYGRHSQISKLLNVSSENNCVPRTFDITLTHVKFAASQWEMDKWPIFVQVHYSHNMVSIYKRQMFVMYLSHLRNTAVMRNSQIFLWFFHTCNKASL
jgi:hypothetical protein